MLVYALVIYKGAILMCQPTFEGGERGLWELPYTSTFPPKDNTTEDIARKILQELTGLSLPVSALVGYCESYNTGNSAGSYESNFIYLMDSRTLANKSELASLAGKYSQGRWLLRNQIDDESIPIHDFHRLVARRVLDNPTQLLKRVEYLSTNQPATERPYTFFM